MNVGTILDDNLDVIEQQGKCSSPGNDTDAEGAKISKNGLDDDLTIAKSSQDKDKTQVQLSNNGLFKNDHELEKPNENNKALKEANGLLTKELKMYKEKLQAKNKDHENVVCNMDKSTETLRLLTNEQRAYQNNIRKSGLGYKGPCVLSQANAKIPKLYSAYEHRDKNIQLHVFDSEKTLEDAEKIQRSKVETNQRDEGKVKVNFVDIETKSIELEHRVASLLRENEHLKLVYKNSFDSIKKLRGKNICENAKCDLQTKIVELAKVLTQKIKDFDDVKLKLSNRTAKFEAYFEKLENKKVVLEQELARKFDDSKAKKDQFLKEINHLSTQLENLKGKSVETKFDKPLSLEKPPFDKVLINSQISKSWFTPKVVVQKDFSKSVTAHSLYLKMKKISF
uniref:Pyruvate, phosphate dikinase regulatory protein, chloroplastic n=1 Tax=Tanacetum cinerariifolium TaxID=118510 RepID=A0A6L2LJL9_TANCI|nr:pyruvate, phosphate dikinase regulatory protein, chloroplastic [Tanacetum cinerariifolium]